MKAEKAPKMAKVNKEKADTRYSWNDGVARAVQCTHMEHHGASYAVGSGAVSWNDTSWRRMVIKFFLREINAHRIVRSNLRRGSASAMRMLRQEACDLGEASRPVGAAHPAL